MDANRTGATLKRLREERGLTLRELAGLTFDSYSQLANIQEGRRWPKDRGWAERVDLVLGGKGQLVAAWDQDQRARAQAEDTVRMLDQARRDSEALLVAPDGAELDSIQDGILHISTNARFEPYEKTLTRALEIRAELMRRVRSGAYRPEEIRELYVALGRTSGVLSYLTLDLGQADTARVHAQAAFSLGDRAGHDHLRAWARGTQALAYRFVKDFEAARDAATDGLNYVGRSTGTAEPRLLCGLAASVANLGDSARALELLEQADRVRETVRPDEVPGLFTFSPAKQVYYHGFSLMWADEKKLLEKSVAASEDAIEAWQAQHSPGDEMLSQIYLSTASARLGDLDASIAAVTPVLESPISAHFSWVRKRLNQLDGLLQEHFPDSRVAGDMRETLRAYVHAA
ncbi:helix-turn-helix domain-containing protein [Nocardia goodfellowii]|uniref:Transcriptional regulator with XRE-family HTH domain n=1 Tax=Nocardia goodfellowii TaxID=882446 RepID=A0ABS4QGI4_9NOCA|nr:helix-turn-helix transcriptional regulator [Nocardia goodfellowii]MBP2189776.1 transcriptional regulator with XRE-family HTH domain [Nocardia goodfellowii]